MLHKKYNFLKKIISMVMMVLLLLPGVGAANEERQDYYYQALAAPKDEMATLYATPDKEGEILGQFYAGALVQVESKSDGWAYGSVRRIGDSWGKGTASGYMATEDLVFGGDQHDFPSDIPIMEVKGTGEVLIGPHKDADILMEIYGRTLVEVLGIQGDYYYIALSGYDGYGYLAKDTLSDTGQTAVPGLGIPITGVALRRWLPGEEDLACYTTLGMDDLTYARNSEGKTFLAVGMVSQVGDFLQGFIHNKLIFCPKEGFKIYPYDTLILPPQPAVSKGTYTMGQGLPPGLYTLEGQDGMIEILFPDTGLTRTWHSEKDVAYTMYLPEGAMVTVNGGTLAPMVNERTPYWKNKSGQPVITGSGRFFTGIQLEPVQHILLLKDQQASGYYCISTLAGDEGQMEVEKLVNMVPGETYIEFLNAGQFIELHNGRLENCNGDNLVAGGNG